ncbi:MAG: hypothetical protein QOF42_3281 [Gammaproteobacteria bacterium]|nr:hypothetical protein [Gammaproteobacteria bacterium]
MYTRAPGLSQPPASSRGTYSARASCPNGGSKNTRLKATGVVRKNLPAPSSMTRPLLCPPKRTSCSCRARAAAWAVSTNTTSRAPLEMASSPNAPDPANRSRQRAPTMQSCSQLNSVSRTRSGVGRNPGRSGKFTRRPRHSPPMIRTELRPVLPGKSVLSVLTAGIIPVQ